MSNDWYSSQSWYAPLQHQEDTGSLLKEKKKGRRLGTKGRITVIVCLLVLLIVGSSLAFSGRGNVEVYNPGDVITNPDDLPESWTDFFDSYYTDTVTEIAEIDIPRVSVPVDFRLELADAAESELSLTELYQQCYPSIVAITGYTEGNIAYSWGTGVVLSDDGYILTNTHVIDDCVKATVTLHDDRVFEAKLVGADSISDIAVLKIEVRGLTPAEFGQSGDLQVGQPVAAIGNPLGETFRMTLTDGIISAIERGISYNGHSMSLLQTNTAINEGNSGGPLFNMYGQVIGITNMKMMSSYSSIEGIGFAIPSGQVRTVVNAIMEYGEYRGRPSVGITIGPIPEFAAEHYGIAQGLYVDAVSEGSDAEAKGVKRGDIIIAVNGKECSSTDDVAAIKNELSVGDSMNFTIWRNGETFDVDIILMDTNDLYK